MSDTIEIKSETRKQIIVDLVGVKYEVKPPKSYLSIDIAKKAQSADRDVVLMMDSLLGWVVAAGGEDMKKDVEKRLRDPKDDLDVQHLSELVKQVVEVTTGNPITSS